MKQLRYVWEKKEPVEWHYQPIDWNTIKFNKRYKLNIMKKLIPCSRKSVFTVLNEYMINDLCNLVIEYLIVDLNISCITKIKETSIPGISDFVNYEMELNIYDKIVILFYSGLTECLGHIEFKSERDKYEFNVVEPDRLELEEDIIDYSDDNDMVNFIGTVMTDRNDLDILKDCINICNDHICYLKDCGIIYSYDCD